MVPRRMSKLLDQRKQAKLQWSQDPSEINWDNLNNIRLEASRHFRGKKRKYLKDKIKLMNFQQTEQEHYELYRVIN
jgi:hypothetical protein